MTKVGEMLDEGEGEQKNQLFLERNIDDATEEKYAEERHRSQQSWMGIALGKSSYRRSTVTSCRRRREGRNCHTAHSRTGHLQYPEGLRDLVTYG